MMDRSRSLLEAAIADEEARSKGIGYKQKENLVRLAQLRESNSGETMATKIGRRLIPNSAETFPNKTAAVLVDDDIEFHGAKVSVSVHNAYRSRLFRRQGGEITIAADRIVRMHEAGVECWL